MALVSSPLLPVSDPPDPLASLLVDSQVWAEIRKSALDLMRRQVPSLKGSAREQEYEDIESIARSRIWQARDRAPVGGNLAGWCFGFVRNVVYEWRRSRTPQCHPAMAAAIDTTVSTWDLLEAREEKLFLDEALKRLPLMDQQLLKLRCDGKTTGEIAECLNLSPDAVRQRLHRVISGLKVQACSGREVRS